MIGKESPIWSHLNWNSISFFWFIILSNHSMTLLYVPRDQSSVYQFILILSIDWLIKLLSISECYDCYAMHCYYSSSSPIFKKNRSIGCKSLHGLFHTLFLMSYSRLSPSSFNEFYLWAASVLVLLKYHQLKIHHNDEA